MSESMEEPQHQVLMPGLDPRPVTMEEYHAYAPERVELLGGYVFEPVDVRRRALQLLLVSLGLADAVKLVPEELAGGAETGVRVGWLTDA